VPVGLVWMIVVVVVLVIGVPLLIVGLALVGPVGWVVAAVLLPVATLAALLWLGREPDRGA
jgi:hypothetical protein